MAEVLRVEVEELTGPGGGDGEEGQRVYEPAAEIERAMMGYEAVGAMTDRITEDLAHQQDSHVSARVPRAEYLGDERASSPRPLRPPGKRHALPGPPPRPSLHPPFPGRPAPETGRAAGGRRDMHAQLRRERQAAHRAASADLVRGPSVAVRAKPTVPHTAPRPRFPSAMRPWTPQHSALQRDKVTHDRTKENGPPAREFAASGPFSQMVWQVLCLGSGHRGQGVSRHRGHLQRCASDGGDLAGQRLPGCRRPGWSSPPSPLRSDPSAEFGLGWGHLLALAHSRGTVGRSRCGLASRPD